MILSVAQSVKLQNIKFEKKSDHFLRIFNLKSAMLEHDNNSLNFKLCCLLDNAISRKFKGWFIGWVRFWEKPTKLDGWRNARECCDQWKLRLTRVDIYSYISYSFLGRSKMIKMMIIVMVNGAFSSLTSDQGFLITFTLLRAFDGRSDVGTKICKTQIFAWISW